MNKYINILSYDVRRKRSGASINQLNSLSIKLLDIKKQNCFYKYRPEKGTLNQQNASIVKEERYFKSRNHFCFDQVCRIPVGRKAATKRKRQGTMGSVLSTETQMSLQGRGGKRKANMMIMNPVHLPLDSPRYQS